MTTLQHNAQRAGGAHNAKVMNRFELTKRLTAQLKHEEAVIGGIGNANFDLWSSGQRPQNFYMLGSMGLAIPIALGVAIARGAGIAKSAWAADEEDFERLFAQALKGGPSLIAARIDDRPGVGTTDRDPVQIRARFMQGLGVKR